MQFGFLVPNFGAFADVRAVAELAAEAEDSGWDGFFVWDHIDYEGIEPNADPWILLTAITLATERVRVGPMVTALPRRHLGKLAREVSTLDHLSNGRVIFGVGAGAADAPESSAFGESTDPRTRADIVDESLQVLCQWWAPGPVSFEGEHIQVSIDVTGPTLQQPRVPIWLAGTWPARRPFRRAARWDGVFPLRADFATGGVPSPDETSAIAETIARHRETGDFDIVHQRVSMLGATQVDVDAQAAAGATWWIAGPAPFEDLPTARDYALAGPPGADI